MGRKTLGKVVKNIMRKAGFERHFTNHSLRRSCATRLNEGGVPEQVIVETTGHVMELGSINVPRKHLKEK